MRRSISQDKYGEMRERLNRRDWKSREPVTPAPRVRIPLSPPDRQLPGVPPAGVILAGMTHRVGRKGQVVIPKAFRKAARIEPGGVTF